MEADPLKSDPKAAAPRQKLRWFQFRLSSLLIFVVICAIPCAWVAKRIEQKHREREAAAVMQRLGGYWSYDDQNEVISADLRDDKKISDSELVILEGFIHLQWLSLDGTGITDAGLVHLKGMSQLTWLCLDRTQVSDLGLVHLKGLPQLKHLSLQQTNVTDSGLLHLKELTRLHDLDLRKTTVTAAGVNDLQQALPDCWTYH